MRACRSLAALLSLAFLPASAGCIPPWIFASDDPPATPPPPEPPPDPPTITSVDAPSWPPLGPADQVTVQALSEAGLFTLTVAFQNTVHLPVSGSSAVGVATAHQLGEGFGVLRVEASDVLDQTTGETVLDVLIDLTPPTIEIGPTVLRADGVGGTGGLEAWVSDRYALGTAELQVGAQIITQTLRTSMPDTIGEADDVALARFDASALPLGESDATLRVYDAAGNATTRPLTLVIDGQAPTASFLSPAAHSQVSLPFDVEVAVDDDRDGPTRATLSVLDKVIATVDDPSTPFTVDTADLPDGHVELLLIGYDEAGNPSAPVALPVEVVTAAP